MPTYCYRKKSGEIVELNMSVSEMVSRQRRNGTIRLPDGDIGERDLAAEHGGFIGTPGNWPMASEAAGVHPTQIGEAYAQSVRDGVPTDFTKDGRPIFRDRRHRARYLRSIGMCDRNAGYSDPAPINR